jgi:eukaryotic-like serine/threonine-protein kinase
MFLGTLLDLLKKPSNLGAGLASGIASGLGASLGTGRFTRAGLRQGDLLRDRYRVIQVLSQGGWGETYISRDLDRPGTPRCVIKLLKPSTDLESSLEMAEALFQREAETLEGLGQHKQIPRLLAYFQLNRNFYLVQEFIDGFPLNSEILPGLQWSESKVISLLIEVLNILTFVHARQVIHRDVKPSNLIRRRHDGRLVLIDFGAVKQIRDPNAITQAHLDPLTVSIGTRGYMPLEQFAGRPRVNSDIYALGVICVQALTGIDAEKLPRNREDEITWQQYAQVSEPTVAIIDKMICSHYRDRYQSCEDVLKDIEKAFPGQLEQHKIIHEPEKDQPTEDPFRTEDDLIIKNYSRYSSTLSPAWSFGILLTFSITAILSFHHIQNFKDYVDLYLSLEAKNWKAADQNTWDLMLGLVGDDSRKRGIFSAEEWEDFLGSKASCQHARRIDSWWNKASEGKLGFSAQMRLLEEEKSIDESFYLQPFYSRIQWIDKDIDKTLVEWNYNEETEAVSYVEGKEPNFIQPVEGHLPAIMFWHDSKDKRFVLLNKCNF